MQLYKSFREEMVEQLQDSDPVLFKDCGKTKENVLADEDLLDCMWVIYQKYIVDYDLEGGEAFLSTLKDVLGIPATDEEMGEKDVRH